jgi:protein tyrosine phosphatase (PTP) superfamily phosphohydrolase (DUF442 family)
VDEVRGGDIFNYLRVDQRLTTSGQPTVAEIEALAREGTQVVINLALHDDPRYSLPDEARSVSALAMTYVHIPVKFDAPTEANLRAFFAAMDAHADKQAHARLLNRLLRRLPSPPCPTSRSHF